MTTDKSKFCGLCTQWGHNASKCPLRPRSARDTKGAAAVATTPS